MCHRLYVHIVWTTRDRAPLVDAARAAFLARFIPAVVRHEHAYPLALGVVTTHVHLLIRLHPSTSISRLLQRMKGGSAILSVREGHGPRDVPLRWAKGYTIESVSRRALFDAMNYVKHQDARHPDLAIPFWDYDALRVLTPVASATDRRAAALAAKTREWP